MSTDRTHFILTALCAIICWSSQLANAQDWQIAKRYNLGDMAAVRADWTLELHQPGWVNNEMQAYVDSPQTLFTRNGHLVIRAYRQNGQYFSSRLLSKQTFTPADYAGKRIRVEFTAKFQTQSGSWPALWMLGDMSTYGGWPRDGEIDVLEWVHQLGDDVKASLHWKGSNDISSDFPVRRSDISTQFYTYGVEYSNHIDDEYVKFYIRAPNGQVQNGPKLNKDVWIWTDFPPCNYQYTAEAARCSYLAPFDNRMNLIMNIAVGGDWGNCCGVTPADYNAFDNGVEMEISDVTIYSANQH